MFDNIRGVIRFRANGIKLYSFINAIRESRIICTAGNVKMMNIMERYIRQA